MNRNRKLKDIALYAWAAVAVLAFAVAFPPVALLYLLFPCWHRKRMARRYRGPSEAELHAARLHWLESL